MWLFTKHGFYSAVQDRDNPARIWVRARAKADLENLRKEFRLSQQIVRSPRADYGWRLKLRRKTWEKIAAQLVASIDYSNFKDAVKACADQQDKLDAYMQVWSAMARYQDREEQPFFRDRDLMAEPEWKAATTTWAS
jgi:hypothetical protein